MKKILSLALAGLMALSLVPASLAEDITADAKAELVTEIATEAHNYLASDDSDYYIYTDMDWSSIADTLPAKFDLRDRGVVPAVRNQGIWGTCWGFAAIGAAETSLLSTLASKGITPADYAELTGGEMDLSERHLAWFGTNHLPLISEYTEGEYPYPESQEGEGLWHNNDESDPNMAHFYSGGMMGFAASVFANGMGPETEADYPYTANNGSTSDKTADWTLPESARFGMFAELKNSAVLPCPAQHDADGNYYYNAAGTEAIKKELLAGRGVSIAYHADQARSPESIIEMQTAYYVSIGFPEDVATVCARVEARVLRMEDMTQDEKRLFMESQALSSGVPLEEITVESLDANIEASWDVLVDAINAQLNGQTGAQELTAEQEAAVKEAAEKLGRTYDPEENAKVKAAMAGVYINTETYGQYTDTRYAQADHGVCIIGWDDDYALSNFPADHQPPAPGAWIVRNSWGEDYGVDGYFYLSYYDQSICTAESFEFVFDQNATSGVQIYTYDTMEASGISSVQMETPVFMANVFPIEDDAVLSYVSVMTTDLNASVTVGVYMLNEGYTSPTDGVLLDSVTETFEFGGYHRIALNYSYQLPAGCTISVVERQRTYTTAGTRYTLPYTNGASEEAAMAQNALQVEALTPTITWAKGCIGAGESFVSLGGDWYDWKDIVADAKAADSVAGLVEFDNLNIKAYLYQVAGVYEAHQFSPAQPFGSGEALICEDCGETLVIVK